MANEPTSSGLELPPFDESGVEATLTDQATPHVSLPVALDKVTESMGLTSPGVQVGHLIGKGGMAVVYSARQHKIRRNVAVKTLTEPDAAAAARLLFEGRLTGGLEHPNIPPVHDIFVDEEGRPQVVFKLIEGDTWSRLMSDAARVREKFDEDDLLAWNLEVMMGVCRALSFAHSRGVLHRDVKPANIMVGRFGEVYLLDWGVALEMDESTTDWGAHPSNEVAGTPAYMAPEQLEGDASLLGPWTDTYLLGATLYHALAGRPPHASRTYGERLREIDDGTPVPPLPEDVPGELRSVILKALQADVIERTVHPEDFRRALAEFLSHRAASRLVARGDRERNDAMMMLRSGSHEPQLEERLMGAEVAYRAALEEWDGCFDAKAGLVDLQHLRVEHALVTGDVRGAQHMMDTFEVPTQLRDRVSIAVADADAEDAALRSAARDIDATIGHRFRGTLGTLIGLVFAAFWAWIAYDPPDSIYVTVGPILIVAGVGAISLVTQGRVMFRNRLNRSLLVVVFATLIAMVMVLLGAHSLGEPTQHAVIFMLLVWCIAATAVAAIVDFRGLPAGVGFLLAFIGAILVPSWLPAFVLLAGLVMVASHLYLNIFVTGRRDPRVARAVERERARHSWRPRG